MKISPINFNAQNFKSSARSIRMNEYGDVVYNGEERFSPTFGPIINSNFTMFFRYDLNRSNSASINDSGNWENFTSAIINEFSNADKVNVYNFGCSDGSEAYSFVLSLIEQQGINKSQKFFPIQAFDIDPDIIKVPKLGKIPCADDDIYRIAKNLKSNKTHELYQIRPYINKNGFSFVPSSELQEKVEFNEGDFVEKMYEIEPSNSLVLCRNFWPYMPKESIPFIINDLCQQIDETSLLVFGAVDLYLVREPLKNNGFEEVYPHIFKKTSK